MDNHLGAATLGDLASHINCLALCASHPFGALRASCSNLPDMREYISELTTIKPGKPDFAKYQNYIVRALTAVFSPGLTNPKVEVSQLSGLKRVDMTFQNNAQVGFFHNVTNKMNFEAGTIVIECKNYSGDIANPEVDQLAGRLKRHYGMVGFIVCRTVQNKSALVARLREKAGEHKLMLYLDDADITQLLKFVNDGRYSEVDRVLTERANLILTA